MPQQVLQMNVPKFMHTLLGPFSVQSAHRLLSASLDSSRIFFERFCSFFLSAAADMVFSFFSSCAI
jgi:hypothetical protein